MPPPLKTPGIYVSEVAASPPIIPPPPPTVTAFIGATTRGASSRAFLVHSFEEYTQRFGSLRLDLELGYALLQFFQNGGRSAWVIRVARDATPTQWSRALAALDPISPLNLLALPGTAPARALQVALPYAQQRRAFLLIDSPRGVTSVSEMITQRTQAPSTPDAALYFPWIEIPDPLSPGRPRLSAPSGSIAGLITQFDSAHGPWKSPAGVGATLDHVIRPSPNLTDRENSELNPRGINCIRLFAGQPPRIVAWGARTLAGEDQLASEWKYISVRRTALLLLQSFEHGLAWTTHEPNNAALWARIRLTAENFLSTLYRKAAFPGTTPREAYFVTCDHTTTSPTDQTQGIVTLLIHFAPVRPAEFITLKITLRAAPPE
jgi:phage tail sheath protein FI